MYQVILFEIHLEQEIYYKLQLTVDRIELLAYTPGCKTVNLKYTETCILHE